MNNISLKNGAWPTMVTPFTKDKKIDITALKELIEWYIKNGADGLFAVCQSSEMFYLSLNERVELASLSNEYAKKIKPDIQVIASGHISVALDSQLEEIKEISKTGIDSFVLVSNRLANENQNDDVFKYNASKILENISNVDFGIYECPYPYKRIMSPNLLKWCADTKRFKFLKDTCCSATQINKKLTAVKGSDLKIYNANSATLLETLKMGCAGYSGVMANFHLKLYHWLVENYKKEPEKAQKIQDFIGISSIIEDKLYPVCAKYNLQLLGVPIELTTRSTDDWKLTEDIKYLVQELKRMTEKMSEEIL